MSTHHKGLDVEQWQQLSLEYQLGNIGSEIARARVWEEKGDDKQHNRALERAFELLRMTTTSMPPDHEVIALQNVVQDKLEHTGMYECSTESLEQYCLPFAILARKDK